MAPAGSDDPSQIGVGPTQDADLEPEFMLDRVFYPRSHQPSDSYSARNRAIEIMLWPPTLMPRNRET